MNNNRGYSNSINRGSFLVRSRYGYGLCVGHSYIVAFHFIYKKIRCNDFLKANDLGEGLVCIPRRRTTSELRKGVGDELSGRNRTLQQHG